MFVHLTSIPDVSNVGGCEASPNGLYASQLSKNLGPVATTKASGPVVLHSQHFLSASPF